LNAHEKKIKPMEQKPFIWADMCETSNEQDDEKMIMNDSDWKFGHATEKVV
jgi:hypothetical protein